MGPVLPEAGFDQSRAPVVNYKAAAQRVPQLVAALESKIQSSDQSLGVSNGVRSTPGRSEAESVQPEKKAVHSNGKVSDENGSSIPAAKDKAAGEKLSSQPTSTKSPEPADGWERVDAPGSQRGEKAAKSKAKEHSEKKVAEKKPSSPPTAARVASPPISPKAAPAKIGPALPEAATARAGPSMSLAPKETTVKDPIEDVAAEAAPANGAEVDAAAASSEKVAVEEKPTRTFCLVRIPRPDGSIGSAAIREAEIRLKDKREKQEFLNVALRLKQISRNEANGKVKEAIERLKACREEVRSRMDRVKPLWDTQRKLQEAGKMVNSKRKDLPCSTEAELDQRIQQLEYTRQHESQSLNEEKKILREIRQLESSREQVKANSALLSQYTSSGAEREQISTQLKPLQEELESLRAAESEAKKALDLVDAEQKELNKGVEELLAQREEAREEHQAAYEELKKLRQQAAQRDHDYYNNRRDIQKFKQLAAQRDIPALEEFANTQVEATMARFSTDPAFRATYVKNNEISTLRRFGSLDTRSPGVDEDPAPLSPTPDKSAGKATLKDKEEAPPKAKSGPAPVKKLEAAAPAKRESSSKTDVVDAKPVAKSKVAAPPPEVSAKSSKPAAPEPAPVDKEAAAAAEAEAKERRREEETRKAKEAEERKRRAAEKKAAKAEQRRKREAEEVAKKKDKKRQTATPPPEAADSDTAASAVTEASPPGPPASGPEAGATSAPDEGARRRQKPTAEKKKRVKPLHRNKKFSLQSWLQDNVTLVAVVALIALVLLAAYIWVNRGRAATI